MAYKCRICGNSQYEKDEISTTGGMLSRFFDVSNKRFTAVSCTKCGHTEFFKEYASRFNNLIDFLGS